MTRNTSICPLRGSQAPKAWILVGSQAHPEMAQVFCLRKRGICFLFMRGRDRKEKRGEGKEWGREGETSEMGQGRADL